MGSQLDASSHSPLMKNAACPQGGLVVRRDGLDLVAKIKYPPLQGTDL